MRGTMLAACLLALPARAATVSVSISGVRNTNGHVLVALCTKADFLRPHCPWKGRVAATPGTVDVEIPNVPPGTYAAQAFHDENDSGRLDRSILGLPKEAMGFSNNAPMHLAPPTFTAAAFTVGTRNEHIAFALRYY